MDHGVGRFMVLAPRTWRHFSLWYAGVLDVETRLVALVVDDNADIRDLLGEILFDALACSVRTASDGQEALESLRACRPLPDIIVLDWMMPHMSGADVLEAMDEDAAFVQVPVVVCSASEVEVPACVPVVRKPVAPEELVAVVCNLLAGCCSPSRLGCSRSRARCREKRGAGPLPRCGQG